MTPTGRKVKKSTMCVSGERGRGSSVKQDRQVGDGRRTQVPVQVYKIQNQYRLKVKTYRRTQSTTVFCLVGFESPTFIVTN